MHVSSCARWNRTVQKIPIRAAAGSLEGREQSHVLSRSSTGVVWYVQSCALEPTHL